MLRSPLLSGIFFLGTLSACANQSLDDYASDEALVERDLELRTDCQGNTVPTCTSGGGTAGTGGGSPMTGPSCDLPCLDADCDYRLYCHSDVGTYGLTAFNAQLYYHNPNLPDSKIQGPFETWIKSHHADLGLISPVLLELVPAHDFRSTHDSLTVFRFDQTYRGLPIFGGERIITLVYNDNGPISYSGTIVNSKILYPNFYNYASSSIATTSILHYAEQQTGTPASGFTLTGLSRVALPGRQQIGWSALVEENGTAVASVVVGADPNSVSNGVLPLWVFGRGRALGLQDTDTITIVTEDPASDPLQPLLQLTPPTTLLTSGNKILGSEDDFLGQPQLATEDIVFINALGFKRTELALGHSRFTDPQGMFVDASGGAATAIQKTYWQMQDYFEFTDRFMMTGTQSRWDSPSSIYINNFVPDTLPGTYRPRIATLMNQNSLSTAAAEVTRARYTGVGSDPPEMIYQPGGGNFEFYPLVNIGGFGVQANFTATLAHEYGHAMDMVVGPGFVLDVRRPCYLTCCDAATTPNCNTPDARCDSFEGAGDGFRENCSLECVEDTTDEAPPMTETVAQLFALLYLHHTFEPLDFDYCLSEPDVLSNLDRTGPQMGAHDPGCLPPGEVPNVFERVGQCGLSPGDCDKPATPGVRALCCDPNDPDDPNAVFCTSPALECPAGFRDALPSSQCAQTPQGYNTYSLMYAWWQLINGYSCDSLPPYTCQTVEWPAGFEPADALMPAFLYALRLQPRRSGQIRPVAVT